MIRLLVLLTLAPPAVAASRSAGAEALIERGHSYYYSGDYQKSFASYESAVKISTTSFSAWVNGAAVLEETGEPLKAVKWYAKAAALSPADAHVLNALGWAQFRAGDLKSAAGSFDRVLARQPDNPYALFGMGRVALADKRPREALPFLQRTVQSSPLLNLTYFFLGKTYESLDDPSRTIEAYRQGVNADSYFMEGRDALGRAYLRNRSFNEAWRQFSRILIAEPRNQRIRAALDKLRPLLARKTAEPVTGLHLPAPYLVPSDPGGKSVPSLRVGVGTTGMGKVRARESVGLSATTPYTVLNGKTGAKLGSGQADEFWQVKVKRVKKQLRLELTDPKGRKSMLKDPVVVQSDSPSTGLVGLIENIYGGPTRAVYADRLMRGQVEVALFKKTLRVVNILDLESYTHGVVGAEMPIRSPVEALKAQAVVARSHALFIKLVTRRHRHEGFDVCDEQHCQVYGGVRAESARSRAVVEGTRGRIVTYKGKVAHVIYSSNCGGYTQSGRDLTRWGDVPYWNGVPDGPDLGERPHSPWQLRDWLTTFPQAYCKPSSYVHPAHFRWTRIVSFKDLEEKVSRKYKVGKLRWLRPLRRSLSGNVNALLIQGAKKSVKIDDEMAIRGLLGIGSIRSTLFVFDTEYGPGMKPESFVFHGGGWGHAVGLCQSGAMGRAEAGQTFEEIIKAYFPGTALGQSEY
mgnify:FL=1